VLHTRGACLAIALAVAPTGCRQHAPQETPSQVAPAAAARPTVAADSTPRVRNSLEALGAARQLELKTALFALNKALISFYVENDRYPADQNELESDPELAGTVADLKKLTTALTYTPVGNSYTLTVTRLDGSHMTLSGSAPGPRSGKPVQLRKPSPPVGT
jgi:hypothetical protein